MHSDFEVYFEGKNSVSYTLENVALVPAISINED
jgi:hypothetical protein